MMGLATSGIIFLTMAWTIIISLVIFSFYKVFKGDKKK
jgi:hypothetical protein